MVQKKTNDDGGDLNQSWQKGQWFDWVLEMWKLLESWWFEGKHLTAQKITKSKETCLTYPEPKERKEKTLKSQSIRAY